MLIGIDTSGKFLTGDGFTPTVVAAAVLPEAASEDLARWIAGLATRWGRHELRELHAQEMSWNERLEACAALSERGDLRFAAIVTDQVLLASTAAVRAHRMRQLEAARAGRATTVAGRRRLEAITALLSSKRLKDQDYVLGTIFPRVISSLQGRELLRGATNDIGPLRRAGRARVVSPERMTSVFQVYPRR